LIVLQHHARKVARAVIGPVARLDLNDRRLFKLLLKSFQIADATRQSPSGMISIADLYVAALVRAYQYCERGPVIRAQAVIKRGSLLACRRRRRLRHRAK
jgi:hypothetical protein